MRSRTSPSPSSPADRLGELEVLGAGRPAPSHEQIESKALGEHVILVELRRRTTRRRQASAPSVARSRPSSSRTPDPGVLRPVSSDTSVDFPLPDGPER